MNHWVNNIWHLLVPSIDKVQQNTIKTSIYYLSLVQLCAIYICRHKSTRHPQYDKSLE